MSKKVTSLTDRLMKVDEQAATPPRIETESQKAGKPDSASGGSTELVGLNFKVPATFRRDFRTYCATHDLTLVEGLAAAFETLKEKDK